MKKTLQFSIVLSLTMGLLISFPFKSSNIHTKSASINIEHRDLYVDGFSSILGNQDLENTLLNFAKANNFNELSLYEVWKITNNTANYPSLAKFISKAKSDYGITKVTVTNSTTASFDECLKFNQSRKKQFEKFDVLSIENEWWQKNAECDFACTEVLINHLNKLKKTSEDTLKTEVYIGWLNSKNNEVNEAKVLIENLDLIAVHCYSSKPDFTYCKQRLSTLAIAAKSLKKKPEISIIFSAEKDFMFQYFSKKDKDNVFEKAFQEFMLELNQKDPSISKYLNISGFKLFTYSEAKLAR